MTTYYVSANSGSNGNDGTSQNSAFATLQQAANVAQSGDTVEVMNGTYTNPGYGQDVLAIRTIGVTFEAAPGQNPVIQFANGNGISVWGVTNVTIQGFDIQGNAQSISQSYASSVAGDTSNPTTNSSGIAVEGASSHITIQDNTVSDAPGAGIYADGSDYININNNTAYGNANWSPLGMSGISISHAQSVDGNTGTKDYVDNNTVYDNAQYVPNLATGVISDGNGIIIDDNTNTQTNNNVYNGRTDVSGNLVYDNGGNGISAFQDVNTNVHDNTAYGNGYMVPGYGDVSINGDAGGNVYNNTGSGSGASVANTPDSPASPSPSSSSQGPSASSGGSSDASGDNTLTINVSADVWNNPPQFDVNIDGTDEGTYSTSTLHSSGQDQAFSFSGLSGGQHTVAITFLNDEYGGTPQTDTNLYVDSMDYAGQHYANNTAAMHSDGTNYFTVGNS